MTGLLIVTHGNFGKELLKSCEMIFGEIPECKAFGLARDESLQELKEEIQPFIDSHDSIFCMVDLFGGSPSNVANGFAKQKKNMIVATGLNMSMVFGAVEARNMEKDVNEMAKEAVNAASEATKVIDQLSA